MSAKPQLKKLSWYVYLVLAFLRVLSTSALSAADCVDSHDNCQYWSTIGECEQNPNYMLANCKHICKICTAAYDDVDDNSTRCGGAIDQLPNALEASSLCTMFERIVQDYNPTIHSQPTAEDDKPWIITIDNFITDEEIDRILQYGESNGYAQSRETYHGNHDGSKTTQMRTSENSWCGYQFGDNCFDDPIIVGLLNRVQEVTHVPIVNYNEMQILRYQPGQYNRMHGDYIIQDTTRRMGGRILTFFLYFNDVEEGGETEFPRLDPPIKVTPKKGTALLWANVKDDDPHTEDTRMWHQALPVVKGKKHAANLWINMRDTRTPIDMKCTG